MGLAGDPTSHWQQYCRQSVDNGAGTPYGDLHMLPGLGDAGSSHNLFLLGWSGRNPTMEELSHGGKFFESRERWGRPGQR